MVQPKGKKTLGKAAKKRPAARQDKHHRLQKVCRGVEATQGLMLGLVIAASPFIFTGSVREFADLPQRVFIQTVSCMLLVLYCSRAVTRSAITLHAVPLQACFAAFCAWALLSVLWAQSGYEALYSSIHWGACAVVMLTVSFVAQDDDRLKRTLISLSAAGTGVLMLGFAQAVFGLRGIPTSFADEPTAVFGNPNVAAEYLAVVVPVIVGMSFYFRKPLRHYVVPAVIGAALLFFAYAHCRAAWAAAFCAVLWTAGVLSARKYGTASTLGMSACVVTVVLLTAGAVRFSPGLRRGLYRPVKETVLNESRIFFWNNTAQMIKYKPLVGVGAGNFRVFYPRFSGIYQRDAAVDKTRQLYRAHNDYLQTAAETGLVGALLFLAAPLIGLYLSLRLIRHQGAARYVPCLAGVSSGLAAFMTVACFSFPLQRAAPALLLALYLGIIAALYSRMHPGRCVLTVSLSRPAGVILSCLCVLVCSVLFWLNIANMKCETHLLTAAMYEKRGDSRSALAAALTACRYGMFRKDILVPLGRAYVATGNYGKASEALAEAVECYPFNMNALLLLGGAYTNQDNKQQALDAFRRILRIRPYNQEVKNLIFLLKTKERVRISIM